MPERPVAMFYAGPNGSRKSTLRELDDDSQIQTHIDPDAIARLMTSGDAQAAGFELVLRSVALDDPDENVARVADRVARGGHHIPEAVIRRRYVESLMNLPRAIAFCDKVIVRDNSGARAVTHLVIENDQIERRTESPPQWILNVEARREHWAAADLPPIGATHQTSGLST